MATPPFNPNENLPGDNDIVSQYPAVEREFRDIVEAWIVWDHSRTGDHDHVSFIDKTGEAPAGQLDIRTVWAEGTVLKTRWGVGDVQEIPIGAVGGIANSGLADMAEGTIKGRQRAIGTGDPQDLTPAQAADVIANFSTLKKGVVPQAAAADITAGKVLGAGAVFVHTGAPHVVLRDQKASGTAGGTFTSGALVTRVLQTKSYDPGSLVDLDTNRFIMDAGVYFVQWSTPGFSCGSHSSVVVNQTDADAVVIRGSSEIAPSGSQSRSHGSGIVTLAVRSSLVVQHRCQTTKATDGLGSPASFGSEIYTMVEIWKVG